MWQIGNTIGVARMLCVALPSSAGGPWRLAA
jgi:hypothetical protein